jgi:hypothetical protein
MHIRWKIFDPIQEITVYYSLGLGFRMPKALNLHILTHGLDTTDLGIQMSAKSTEIPSNLSSSFSKALT